MFHKLKTAFLVVVFLATAPQRILAVELPVQKNSLPAVQRETAAPAAPAPAAALPLPAPAAKATPIAVLERFRTYTGLRTPAILAELFKAPVFAGIRQQPELVLTTGAEPVGISINLPGQGDSAPNIAFSGARLLSNTRTGKDEWYVEALPEAGVLHAEMIILTVAGMVEIPLTVAPALPEGADLSEAGFASFLGGKDAVKPQVDLNGDGKKDYLDIYLFTANFIATKRSPHQDHAISPEPHVNAPGDAPVQDEQALSPSDKQQVPPPPSNDADNSLQITGGWGAGGQTEQQIPPGQSTTQQQQQQQLEQRQQQQTTQTPAKTEPPFVCDNTNLHDLRCRNQRARNWNNRFKQ